MAKNEKSKDVEKDAPQAVEAADVQLVDPEFGIPLPIEPPVAAMPEPVMAVEKKEAHHRAAVDPNRALEPGRDEKPAHNGAQGEVEKLLIDAVKNNNQPLVADCQMLLVKLGELKLQYSLFNSETQGQFSDQLKKLAELFSS